jgi:hypothetical protein
LVNAAVISSRGRSCKRALCLAGTALKQAQRHQSPLLHRFTGNNVAHGVNSGYGYDIPWDMNGG